MTLVKLRKLLLSYSGKLYSAVVYSTVRDLDHLHTQGLLDALLCEPK